MSAAEPFHGASVGVVSAEGPPRGVNCAPSGGSEAAELVNEAASVGVV